MKRAINLVFDPPRDFVETLLPVIYRAIQRHPLAARAIVAALVEEGRRFAVSPEGAPWLARLSGSELVEQVRLIWETVSLTSIPAGASEALPSACVDAIVQATAIEGLEPLLSNMMLEFDK